jgi:hypothetical protein
VTPSCGVSLRDEGFVHYQIRILNPKKNLLIFSWIFRIFSEKIFGFFGFFLIFSDLNPQKKIQRFFLIFRIFLIF